MNNGEIVIKYVLLNLFNKLEKSDFRNNTVELLNVHLEFNPNEAYIDYGMSRLTNREYVARELDWYLSRDKSIHGHIGIENNKIWKSCATDDLGLVNSNYGAIVFDRLDKHLRQFDYAIDKLVKDKCSRQSVIIYTRPSLHWESCDNIHAKHDFTCTTHTQHFITNDNKFIYIVNMRSNDAIFGLQNDYCWHRYVYFKMFETLRKTYPDLQVGSIYWNTGSMHIYDRHYDILAKIVAEYRLGLIERRNDDSNS